jgi:hypothetical protein
MMIYYPVRNTTIIHICQYSTNTNARILLNVVIDCPCENTNVLTLLAADSSVSLSMSREYLRHTFPPLLLGLFCCLFGEMGLAWVAASNALFPG